MADGIIGNLAGPAFTPTTSVAPITRCNAVGALGICIGPGIPSSWDGTNTALRHYQVGARRSDVEGTPAAPSLQLDFYGFWRFRWAVTAGSRSITIFAKQITNTAGRPSIVLKANTAVGLLADVTATMGSSIDWISATASFTATATGMVWVELHNNCLTMPPDPCFFDRISIV